MYASDLTNEQWDLIENYFKRPDPRGAVSKYPKRTIVNAIFYIVKTGAQWRMLPKDFPPWQTVYDHFRRLRERGIWGQVLADLTKHYRIRAARNPNPSYGIIDSQSVKTLYSGEERGFDGGKKNKRKKKACLYRYSG